MLHVRNIVICKDRYTEDEKQASGRMRVMMQIADEGYPDAKDCVDVDNEAMKRIRNRMNKQLKKSGLVCKGVFKPNLDIPDKHGIRRSALIDLWSCHLTDEYVQRYGNNIDPITNEKTRKMGFYDIVEAANIISNTIKEFEAEGSFFVLDPLTIDKIMFDVPQADVETVFSDYENKIVYIDVENDVTKVISKVEVERHNLGDFVFLRHEFYGSDGKGRVGFWKERYKLNTLDGLFDDIEKEETREEDILMRAKMGSHKIEYKEGDVENIPDMLRQISERRKKSNDSSK